MTDHERIGTIETVQVNGTCLQATGRVYHVRLNGWACIAKINGQHLGCGPKAREKV